ncbi:glycosyl transferase group 1 family protein [Asticcacaulis biprosthecium C19]|uniref:Glycosyl transferase group 1 family protein n=1 Tax=Asticcacaulis biprosthecium C19 TaxID=715226 RepID=F4QMS7_9CAUL|nr:glycosyltransferase family 4 protein [Asticcacaulis biprosthecium]EGF91518.1 glycosyl transferase group 1 family protein [Asticcacaulis biprosthecium C19]
MLQSNSFQAANRIEDEDFSVIDIPFLNDAKSGAVRLTRPAIIGNFPPRQCGLATFTRDMYACLSMALPKAQWSVVAMNDPGASYDYPAEVTHQLPQNDIEAYRALADELNTAGNDVVFVQHEFGIYGGPSGRYLLAMLERLNMPIVTTLHTILEKPNAEQRLVMDALIRLSDTLVTMAQKGKDILMRVYQVPEARIAVIPHGAPSRPLRDTTSFKAELGLTNKKTLTTFGLLSPNKGIETVIQALPDIVRGCPNLIYLVIGATHPHLIRNEGEKYRDSLKQMARDLGVERHVHFINSFVNDAELVDILQATDVYVTPYLTETQITSGTLSYALALGRPIVSTPYWHAQEVLAGGVGALCPFKDVHAFTLAISNLLASDTARTAMSQRAYQAGLSSRWSAVANAYVTRAEADAERRTEEPGIRAKVIGDAPAWGAIERMTDSCGIFQHGKYGLPDREHGYCADDNCRALSLAARLSNISPLTPRQIELTRIYAAFMNHAWNHDTRFRNFMSFGRQWLDDGGSDDCCARSFECLVDVARSNLPEDLRTWAVSLANDVLGKTTQWQSLRARAILIRCLVRGFGVIGDPQEVQVLVRKLGQSVHGAYRHHARAGHKWFEPYLAYDNARLSEGLILAGQFLVDNAMLNDGIDSLRWLMQRQTDDASGCFVPVPTSHFKEDSQGRNLFDQQPIEVVATVEACLTAWTVTTDSLWRNEALRSYAWFHGENVHSLPMVTADGGCYDGLNPNGFNQNQGAESILAYPLSWTALKAGL